MKKRSTHQKSLRTTGLGYSVEVDETVLSRRGIIRNPTIQSDEVRDTVWRLGAIENTPEKIYHLKCIEQRNRNNNCCTRTLSCSWFYFIFIWSCIISWISTKFFCASS
ncbi:hypothetical protein DMUE_3230 [Dictyocoela muelleri]|nr:hypothetical protein DMUE_3230 [Dictyocoela muelleri]